MTNQKYEITDIIHGKYPFLHRVRALRDIGKDVKAGDLGGFVEHEGNLSFEPGDDAWVCDEAIAAGDSVVEKGSVLRGRAVACGSACVSHGSVLFGDARAEDDAYLRGATMWGCARASGASVIVASPDDPARAPRLSGSSWAMCICWAAPWSSVARRCATPPRTASSWTGKRGRWCAPLPGTCFAPASRRRRRKRKNQSIGRRSDESRQSKV